MAKQVNEWPNSARRFYPWDEWLNGDIWELERDQDFVNTAAAFRAQAYVAAKARGLRVRTTSHDADSLTIQAYQ